MYEYPSPTARPLNYWPRRRKIEAILWITLIVLSLATSLTLHIGIRNENTWETVSLAGGVLLVLIVLFDEYACCWALASLICDSANIVAHTLYPLPMVDLTMQIYLTLLFTAVFGIYKEVYSHS